MRLLKESAVMLIFVLLSGAVCGLNFYVGNYSAAAAILAICVILNIDEPIWKVFRK